MSSTGPSPVGNRIPMIRVVVCDSRPLLRAGIAAVLQAAGDIELAAEPTADGEASELLDLHRPDVALLEDRPPPAACDGTHWRHAVTRVIVLSTLPGDGPVQRALRAGASGYLPSTVAPGELLDAVRVVHAGGRYVHRDAVLALARHLATEPLSCRELAVLKRVAEGESNKGVGSAFGLAEDTVKSHMKNIIVKLGARDRTHAVTIALRRGLMALA